MFYVNRCMLFNVEISFQPSSICYLKNKDYIYVGDYFLFLTANISYFFLFYTKKRVYFVYYPVDDLSCALVQVTHSVLKVDVEKVYLTWAQYFSQVMQNVAKKHLLCILDSLCSILIVYINLHLKVIINRDIFSGHIILWNISERFIWFGVK